MRRRPLGASLLAVLAGCGGGATSAPGGAQHVRLGPDEAAVVGHEAISPALVGDVARARHIPPRLALDALIDDALAAEGARVAGLDRLPPTSWAVVSIAARSAADRTRDIVHAAGPPTDAEVAASTANHWRDLDLPEQWKVIHAVIKRPTAPDQVEAARALAAQLASVEAAAKSPEDFEARAKAFPHGAFELTEQPLPPFVADGRFAEGPDDTLLPGFVRGATQLREPGETSGVVESSYGWHVIRLLERRPAHVVPLEERRRLLADEIYAHRAQDAVRALRAGARVEVVSDADSAMAEIPVTPR